MRSVVGIGSWSARRPWRAIAIWLGFVVAVLALGIVGGTKSLENGAIGESARGYAIMDAHRSWPPAREYAYVHSRTLTAADDAFQGAALDAAAAMRAAVGEKNVRLSRSADGHAVLVTGQITHFVEIDRLRAAVLAAGRGHPEVTVEETGDITASDARDKAVNRDLHRAELLSVPVTLLVLLFAFGAIVAAVVPVLLALTAVAAAFGLLGPASQLFPLDDSVKIVVVLIGMAVGVDYALFYIIRSRAERGRGLSSHAALERTARTSGRTVVISGTTVVIAMSGMFLIGAKVFNGIAAGTIIVVACAVAGSVTVLCAVLELLGTRIDRGRIPFLPHLQTDSSASRFWPAVIDRVLRRPALSCALSAGFLLALAIPALWMHVGSPSDESLSSLNDPALAALPRMHADFPGTSTPALVALTGPKEAAPAVRRELRHLQQLVQARGIAHPPFTISGGFDDRAATLELPLDGAGDDAASRNTVEALRTELVPETLGTIPGVETAVTGTTAENIDFTRDMKRGVPYVIAFVLSLAFLLLLVAFRSIVVPLKAIALNLLSVGASYGLLVLVFQHDWAEPILGFTSNGLIISWLPLFLFVILFGLSMDYHVFILSRVREAVDGGMPTDAAVRYGITATAGVVTSAALVMVGVFALFGSLSSLDVKQAGVGLAAAVLIDATIVRAVLLPSSMRLLGEWNWYLPRFLHRIPKVAVEAPPVQQG